MKLVSARNHCEYSNAHSKEIIISKTIKVSFVVLRDVHKPQIASFDN